MYLQPVFAALLLTKLLATARSLEMARGGDHDQQQTIYIDLEVYEQHTYARLARSECVGMSARNTHTRAHILFS